MIVLWFWMAVAQDQRRLLAEVETFDTQIAALDGQVTALRGKAEQVRAQEASHQGELAAAETALTARRAGEVQRVQTFYRLKRRGLARLLFDAESPVELRRRVRYLLAVIRSDEAENREFAEIVRTQRATQEKVAADRKVIEGLQTDLEKQIVDLETQRQSRVALLRDIRAKPEMARAVLRERAEVAEEVRSSLPTTNDATSFRDERGRLPAPVAGRVRRGYGSYTDPASGAPAQNLGLDYDAALGAPFRAVADGVIQRSGYVRGYGQVVVVQHGAYTTLYAHANGLRVAQGQQVRRGDVLGLVGNTGLTEDADACLHFEVRYNGTPQDPGEWLAR